MLLPKRGDRRSDRAIVETGTPSFGDCQRAGVVFSTNRAYLEALHLIRTSTPKAGPPTHYVVLHADVNPRFSLKVRYENFDIGSFQGWIIAADSSTSSDFPSSLPALVRADGAFLPLPRFQTRSESTFFNTISEVTISRDPKPDRPSTMRKLNPDIRATVNTSQVVRSDVERAKALLVQHLAKGSTSNDVELTTESVEHSMFLALFRLYKECFS